MKSKLGYFIFLQQALWIWLEELRKMTGLLDKPFHSSGCTFTLLIACTKFLTAILSGSLHHPKISHLSFEDPQSDNKWQKDSNKDKKILRFKGSNTSVLKEKS